MQILYLGIIFLTSISSTPPLSWPPVNQKCQITHVDLWEFEFWCDMKWSPTDSAEKSVGFESNTALCIFKYYSSNTSSQEKSYSIWTLRINLGNHFMFTNPGNSSPQKHLQTCISAETSI